jgi:hypothetical protein
MRGPCNKGEMGTFSFIPNPSAGGGLQGKLLITVFQELPPKDQSTRYTCHLCQFCDAGVNAYLAVKMVAEGHAFYFVDDRSLSSKDW